MEGKKTLGISRGWQGYGWNSRGMEELYSKIPRGCESFDGIPGGYSFKFWPNFQKKCKGVSPCFFCKFGQDL